MTDASAFEDLQCTLVINGLDYGEVTTRFAGQMAADARYGTSMTAFSTTAGRCFAFAGPMSVGVQFELNDETAADDVAVWFAEYVTAKLEQVIEDMD